MKTLKAIITLCCIAAFGAGIATSQRRCRYLEQKDRHYHHRAHADSRSNIDARKICLQAHGLVFESSHCPSVQ